MANETFKLEDTCVSDSNYRLLWGSGPNVRERFFENTYSALAFYRANRLDEDEAVTSAYLVREEDVLTLMGRRLSVEQADDIEATL